MEDSEVIDLTQPFTISYSRGPNLNCAVIDLDDSLYASPRPVATSAEPVVILIDCETQALPAVNITKESQSRKSTGIKKKKHPRTSAPATSSETPKTPNYGDCPICRDPLGTRLMASTKCGHVYCIACITQALQIEKKCPTCRKPLKGVSAFHPLYL